MKRGWNAFAALRTSVRPVTMVKLTLSLVCNFSRAVMQPVDTDEHLQTQATRGRGHVEPTRGRAKQVRYPVEDGLN